MNSNEKSSDSPSDIALGLAAGVALFAAAAFGYNALKNQIDVRKGGEKQSLIRLVKDFTKK